VSLVSGPVLQEVVQGYAFGSGLVQRVRLYNASATSASTAARLATGFIEVIHEAGRLPGNRELVTRLATDLRSGIIPTAAVAAAGASTATRTTRTLPATTTSAAAGAVGAATTTTPVLHTEASGFSELYARPFNATASIAQNYHAVVQTAVLRDERAAAAAAAAANSDDRNGSSRRSGSGRSSSGGGSSSSSSSSGGGGNRQLTILVPRAMGIASLAEGEVELMLARRITTQSDNQGPWPLDDRVGTVDAVRLVLASSAEVGELGVVVCRVNRSAFESADGVVICWGWLGLTGLLGLLGVRRLGRMRPASRWLGRMRGASRSAVTILRLE
jgi:hypothetical protein